MIDIDVIDMDEPDNQDPPADAGAGQQQAPPPVPIVDTRAIAQDVTRNVISALGQGFQTRENQDIIAATAQKMASRGIPKEAIEAVIEMNMAFTQVNEQRNRLNEQTREVQTFARNFWKQANEVFERYSDKLSKDFPAIDYAKDGILEAYKHKLETDPKYAKEWKRIEQNGELPSLKTVSTVMASIVQDVVHGMGGGKSPQSVALGGAKPPSGGTAGGDLTRLDAHQLKQYHAFKRTKGDEFDKKSYERALRS